MRLSLRRKPDCLCDTRSAAHHSRLSLGLRRERKGYHRSRGVFLGYTGIPPEQTKTLMTIKQIRVSSQARDQLIRLKTRTGITQWNILCRFAFCLSLREPTPPTPIDVPADSNVEMTWPVFAGEHHELYLALLKERCHGDGVEPSDKELNRQFRLHLHRGIGYLASPNTIRSIADLVRLSISDAA